VDSLLRPRQCHPLPQRRRESGALRLIRRVGLTPAQVTGANFGIGVCVWAAAGLGVAVDLVEPGASRHTRVAVGLPTAGPAPPVTVRRAPTGLRSAR